MAQPIGAYNGANRLAQVTYLGAPLAAYTYNHSGRRTRKVTPAGTLVYHYDPSGQLLMETTAAGVPLRTYLWLDNTPLAQIDTTPTGPNLLYLHTDHLDTPRAATNNAGTTVWRWAGEAFGSTDPLEDPDGDSNPTVVNLRFPGQYFDAETGFFYNWNRYYDPRLGRYISSDPIGLDGGLNTYAYVDSNPLSFFDPDGLAKGGKQNIGTEGFTKRSDPKAVEEALKDALKNDSKNTARIKKLRGLLKVIKRGGRIGVGSIIPFDDEFFCATTGMFCEPPELPGC